MSYDDFPCGNCGHPRSSHGLDRTPPCIDSDASPCFCMKFKETGEFGSVRPPGETVEHSTGAVRGSAVGRGRYDLISPIMMDRLAKHLEAGARNYGDRNWERGLPIARMFQSLFRHSWQAFAGQTDEDHLAAVICNAMFIMHTLEMIVRGRLPAGLNDLPDYSNAGVPAVESAPGVLISVHKR